MIEISIGQLIALGISCFAFGISIATIIWVIAMRH